jgi:hypothetical protein
MGVNVDTERANTRSINFLKKEVGIVEKKSEPKKNYNKKPYVNNKK